jgi:preprotein translocase subunit SecY
MKRSNWRYLWTAHDIRRKLLITLLLLGIYRLAAHIPVPGADPEVIRNLIEGGSAGSQLVGILDLLSGGTIANFSVLAMGVYPYITAQIILQLLVPIIPALQRRMEEDPRETQKWMEKWTMLLAIPMAALNAIGQINLFTAMTGGIPVIPNFGLTGDNWLYSLTVIISMTAGTMFAIWLGELISEFGIRNQGLSLIIFAGIVARVPANLLSILADERYRFILLFIMVIVTVLTIFAIIYVQQGRRNVPIIYKGRMIGRRMTMSTKTYLPLMINMAGMIPLIFAQSILTFPAVFGSFFLNSGTPFIKNMAESLTTLFGGEGAFFNIMYFLFVVVFTFFYTSVLFQQQNYGRNLVRAGAEIPNISPREDGKYMQAYLSKVQSRITLPGALFLGLVAILPWLLSVVLPGGLGKNAMLIQSAGLLIVVGVVRDVFFNIEAELKQRYDEKLLVR